LEKRLYNRVFGILQVSLTPTIGVFSEKLLSAEVANIGRVRSLGSGVILPFHVCLNSSAFIWGGGRSLRSIKEAGADPKMKPKKKKEKMGIL
jgi:hypothetical protein